MEFVIILQIRCFRGRLCKPVFYQQLYLEKDVVCHSHTPDALQTFHPEENTPSGFPGSSQPAHPAEWNPETVKLELFCIYVLTWEP